MLITLAGAVVTTVSPLAVRPAYGQGTGSYYYENYVYGYNPGYYARSYAVRPLPVMPSKLAPLRLPYVYYVPAPAAAAKGNAMQSVDVRMRYGAITPALADAPPLIELHVPADAQVWFGGQKTTQIGTLRHFESPPLTSGRTYTSEVRATWKEGEREVTESRRLSIRADDSLSASFPDAAKLTVGKDANTPR
jgi:uncharacterized protein (TIGR03000 family)